MMKSERFPLTTPFYSQWESRDLTLAVLSDAKAALLSDPLWTNSGANDIDEYAFWANNICGMACLKMVLAARNGRIFPTIDLAHAAAGYGAYVVNAETAVIKGLIYAPFVRFIEAEHNLRGEVITGISAGDLPKVMARSEFLLASVHPAIRWPNEEPLARGGHLVLVLSANEERVVFHNPSGHDQASQENVSLPLERFEPFFAGRGVAIMR